MKKLIKFSATWCHPCTMLSNTMKTIDFGDIEVEEVDIDEQMERAVEYKVRGVPTLVLEEDGVEIKRSSGMMMKGDLEDFIK